MINIRRMWQPLTATPFLATAAHHEIPPCESLQRWIRCFWGGIIGAGASPTRIIPDVCADLIYHIDETAGRIIQASFCGVSDVCGTAHLPLIPGHTVSTFAIRFHAFFQIRQYLVGYFIYKVDTAAVDVQHDIISITLITVNQTHLPAILSKNLL